LNGWAGTGKSTIARTIARKYYGRKLLGASFFFSRGGGDVGHASKFFTSIAVQLANNVPPLRRHICEAVTERMDIATQSLRDQWRQLVLGPLSKLEGKPHPAYILVVDALDECDDENQIRSILQLLAEVRSLKTVRLRVFLTSRPESPIRYQFHRIPDAEHQDFILHNISPSTGEHDISVFVEYNLRLLRQEQSLDDSWPGEKIVRYLIQSANGLFIWAATACRFIREGPFAEERLRMRLEGGTFATTPEEHLDRIYITVLRNSILPSYMDQERQWLYGLLKDILGSVVVLFSPLTSESLSKLLNTKRDIGQALKDLHAIIDIPNDRTLPIRLHHPSFRDFLLDPDRCRDPNFRVEREQAHRRLTDSCIRVMSNSLKRDILELDTPGALVTDVASSRVEEYLPPEVQYACLYWVQHLQKSGAQLSDGHQVHQFLQTHLLHWLEALGWMRKLSEGIVAITFLESVVHVSVLAVYHEMYR